MGGLSNEGVIVHAPARGRLLTALESALDADSAVGDTNAGWSIVSNRKATLELLRSAGTVS